MESVNDNYENDVSKKKRKPQVIVSWGCLGKVCNIDINNNDSDEVFDQFYQREDDDVEQPRPATSTQHSMKTINPLHLPINMKCSFGNMS